MEYIGSIPVAISALVATATFIVSVVLRRRTEREQEVARWQRVVVYSIVNELRNATFKDIKSRYLENAAQVSTFRLPKEEIQDDALRRILLELMRDDIVVQDSQGSYRISAKPYMEEWAQEALEDMLLERRLKPKILRMVERQSGTYTADSLVRALHQEGLNVDFDKVDTILDDLRGYGGVRKDPEGRLHYEPPYGERDYRQED
jgi:hypothetical protein